jgi:DNA-binding transcriptional regulator YiaG
MARKVDIYDHLREALAGALAYERGTGVDLRVTEIPTLPKSIRPEEIRAIRENLHATQALFARYIGVSPKAVQSWEQGTRRPQSTALRLLSIAKENPRILLSGTQGRARAATA